jgi:nitroimidazol reductase NimA-like FMN-containing flavoprotein (pyridoxamine 5'-phosphate oxidase superfamily)
MYMRTMRRKDREITTQAAVAILDVAEYGVLSTVTEDGQPYGVPLSYIYKNDAIYFHCAIDGQKLDNIAYNPKISFCVVGNTNVLPDTFGTEYESVVIFGTASEIHGDERYMALVSFLEKYCSEFVKEGLNYIHSKDRATKVYKIEISYISGKSGNLDVEAENKMHFTPKL